MAHQMALVEFSRYGATFLDTYINYNSIADDPFSFALTNSDSWVSGNTASSFVNPTITSCNLKTAQVFRCMSRLSVAIHTSVRPLGHFPCTS